MLDLFISFFLKKGEEKEAVAAGSHHGDGEVPTAAKALGIGCLL